MTAVEPSQLSHCALSEDLNYSNVERRNKVTRKEPGKSVEDKVLLYIACSFASTLAPSFLYFTGQMLLQPNI